MAALETLTRPGWSRQIEESDVVGNYKRVGLASVSLDVTSDIHGIRAVVSGDGSSRSDGAAAADCIIDAVGVLHDGWLSAAFQPIETDEFSYSRAKANAEKRRLDVVFSPGAADVKRADTFGYCGLGINFLGAYKKTK